MSVDALFTPFSCKSLRLRNRIALASVARWGSPDGNPAPLVDFYRARIEGGASLAMTEGAAIDRPASFNDPRGARFFGSALDGWRKIVEAVHGSGGAIIPQLWHAGAVAKKASDWKAPSEPESPSGLVARDLPRGHKLSDADIADLLRSYNQAAADAMALKMDAVEVHAGHGYLLDQFFWEQTNQRTDRWGGKTLPERARFPLEVVKTVRKTIGSDTALMVRISNWKSAELEARMFETPGELEAWLSPFAKAGVDIFSVSEMRYDRPIFANSPLGFAGWVRKITGLPVMAAGGIGMSGDIIKTFAGETGRALPVDDAARRVEEGEFDLVGIGRALVADPEWPRKIARGQTKDLRDCTPELLAPQLKD